MMTVLDLCSGIGGFSLGLERTGGFKTVAFCEIDPYCQKVLAKHWPGVPIHDDVRTMPKIESDVISAGFPCQDISNAGQKAGISGARSGLWGRVAELVGDIRPKYVLLENVAALLNRGIDRVLGDLAEVGYDAEWHCIPASAVGAPHLRDRIWIVAYPQRDGQPRPRLSIRPEHSAEDAYREANRLINAVQGDALPFVCRGHDGVSSGVARDRLRALGNAVVPQIPEMIGRAILRAEA